jgi:hypothetical protein
MRVDYTLPGVLPEVTPTAAPAMESGEGETQPFGAHFQRLQVPDVTDWRVVLRLNTLPGGAANIGPPAPPYGIDSRDGASQRAWWRGMLYKHARSFENGRQATSSQTEADGHASVARMLGLLSESQRCEDAIFARHFAEGRD